MKSLTLLQPDDWHVHFRDKESLKDTVNATAKTFARALVMPNLIPPLTTLPALLAYRARIQQALEPGNLFEPFMTFYINESLSPEVFDEARKHAFILGAKLYPAHATTNAQAGAKDISSLYPHFELMQDNDMTLQIHGEEVDADIFDREADFIDKTLRPIIKNFPKLRIVLEHISTQAAVDFITEAPARVAATLTPHHLMYNRNHMLSQGIRPHLYCLPILKRQSDQAALIQAAISGNPKFFAGTDSAPHTQAHKETACGCAGIYSAPYALALYAEVFDKHEALARLEGFVSRFGAAFYNQPLNQQEITLINTSQQVPLSLPLGNDVVVPVAAGERLAWSLYE